MVAAASRSSDHLKTLANVMAKFFTTTRWRTYTDETLDKFSPKAQSQKAVNYATSIRLNTEHLPDPTWFDAYASHRSTTDKTLFKSVAQLDLANDDIRAAINDVLQQNPEATAAQTTFKKEMQQLINSVKDPKFEYSAVPMIGLFEDKIDNARKAITEQHTRELQRLETACADGGSLRGVIPGKTDAEYNTMKETMEKELKKAHEKALDNFNKSANDALATLRKDRDQRATEVAILATLFEQMKTRDELLKFLAAAKKGGTEVSFGREEDEEGSLFASVKIGTLMAPPHSLYTLSGRKMSAETAEERTTLSINLPHHLNFKYYYSPHHNPKADLIALIQAARAADPDKVGNTMTIDDPIQANADELARYAYEACLEQGYSEKEIVLIVNGVTLDEAKCRALFKDHPEGIAVAKQKGEQYKEQQKAAEPTKSATLAAKTKLNSLVSEHAAAAAEAAATAAANQAQDADARTGLTAGGGG